MASRIVAVLVALLIAGYVFAQSQPPSPAPSKSAGKPKTEAKKQEQKAEPDKRRTDALPAVVEISKAPVIRIETADKSEKTRDYTDSEWWMVYITGGLAIITFFLALYTAGLYRATVGLGEEAKSTAEKQFADTQESLRIGRDNAEALKKSALAAENTADIMVATAQAELRPYLTVIVGTGMYQDRTRNLRFAVHPWLFNSGRTPAHKMRYWARAGILPFPLPHNFDFPMPENVNESAHVIGPSQGIELNAVVDDFVPDEQVAEIKLGNTRRVHIWGVVTYHDSFHWQTTNFCHSICWIGPPDAERISGTYSFQHNEAT